MGGTESSKGKKWVLKNGKWEEGKAAPEQKPERLRVLPADWVTKEESDPDRIHELDDPHIVEALKLEQEKKLQGKEEKPEEHLKKIRRAPQNRRVPLSQELIDTERFITIYHLIQGMVHTGILDTAPRHMWFNANDVNNRTLRDGNAPADKDRPKYLRGFDLAIDITKIPERIRDALAERGVPVEEMCALPGTPKPFIQLDL